MTKNHARSSSIEMARHTALFTPSIRSPDIEPDLSTMKPMTTWFPPETTSGEAVTERMASTRPRAGGKKRFWNASILNAMSVSRARLHYRKNHAAGLGYLWR
jgi:hypothetical protein